MEVFAIVENIRIVVLLIILIHQITIQRVSLPDARWWMWDFNPHSFAGTIKNVVKRSTAKLWRLVVSSKENFTLPDFLNQSSRFLPNSTFETIVNEMMIEYFNSSISYDLYYEKCRPVSCTYTHEIRSNLIYIVTTIIGLIGIDVILRLVCPLIGEEDCS